MKRTVVLASVLVCGWLSVIGVFSCTVAAQAQPPDNPRPAAQPARLTFEVASVKIHRPGDGVSSVDPISSPNRYSAINLSLELLIINAYNLRRGRLEGIPGSMVAPRFDVIGTTDGPRTPAEKELMLQSVLADRFKLVLGRKQVESDIYVLLVDRPDGRLGPNLKPSSDECQKADEWVRTDTSPDPLPPEIAERCFGRTGTLATGWQVKGLSMGALASYLRMVSSQEIDDRTSLSGVFDFQLRASLRDLRPLGPPPPDTADAPPSIFNALRDQLGLKLERRRVPIEHLVVEHVEMPTPD